MSSENASSADESPPSSDPVGPGSLFGKYEIIRHLATGGMAEIYLARMSGVPGFQKVVCLKRIRPELASKKDFVEMFLDEARIAATLEHPNVVQTYDVGTVDGNYFIAMEYLHGEILSAMMHKVVGSGKMLPIEHSLNIGIALAQGLHYAHERKGSDGKPLEIIHRDVTPQNVILTYEGGVKLLDFGIAKATNKVSETRSGTLKGKLSYMSPEQCNGENLDRRSDIFSLGIVLWEMTVGRRLFRGQGDFSIMKAIVEGQVDKPTSRVADYPPALEAIVMKALEKDRDKRYATARELAQALEGYVRDNKIFVSQSGMQTFMEETFGNKIEAWREAQAKGKSLADHLKEAKSAEMPALADGPSIEISSGPWSGSSSHPSTVTKSQRRVPGESSISVMLKIEPGNPRRNKVALGATLIGVAMMVGGYLYAESRHPKTHPVQPVVAAPTMVVTPVAPAARPVVAPRVTTLRITTQPAGAVVTIDGKSQGRTTPLLLDQLESDQEHTLHLELDGYRDEDRKVTLAPGETRSIELSLTKEPAKHHGGGATKPAAGTTPVAVAAHKDEPVAAHKDEPPAAAPLVGDGTLIVSTTPWVNVTIDGVLKGPTPVSVKLPAGPHTVLLANPEFAITRTLQVQIVPGQIVRKKLEFN